MSWNPRRQRIVRAALHTAWICTVFAGCGTAPTGLSGAANPILPSPTSAGGSPGFGTAGAGTALPVTPVANLPLAGGMAKPTPSAGAGVAGAGGTMVAPPTATGILPCGVSKALVANCQSCHGATPIGGAPMSLVTYADVQAQAKTKPTLKVSELMKMRLHDQAKPMPPGGMISAMDLQTLDTWLNAGAQAGAAADANCAMATPVAGSEDGSTGPITPAAGETCYDFYVHQSTTSSTDTTPYSVSVGEHYEQFYYKAPWPAGTVATRYGTRFDNQKVLHHWLLFSTSENEPEGNHVTAPLPTLLGVNATLLAGWAVGGTNLALPKDVAFEIPGKGSQLNIQWHFYNSTTTPQQDHSAVQICTVPAGMRAHTATISWIGTEDIGGNKWFGGAGMPAHQKSTFSGTCDPLREGMNSTDPIHILGFWPHMHQLGINMKAIVNHKGGMAETIFNKPFDFNHQVHYLQDYELKPGDTLTAVCDFNNTTAAGVPFGESSDTEMCYNFTMAWPAHALENHITSLIGATNTCW
jgi:hypothetical protein